MSHYKYYDNLTVISKDQNDFKIKIFLSLTEKRKFIVCIEYNYNIFKSEIYYDTTDLVSYCDSRNYENDYSFNDDDYYKDCEIAQKNNDININNAIQSITNKNFFIDYKYHENYKFFPELLNFLCFTLVVNNKNYEFKIPKIIDNNNNNNDNKINYLEKKIIELENTINEIKQKKN